MYLISGNSLEYYQNLLPSIEGLVRWIEHNFVKSYITSEKTKRKALFNRGVNIYWYLSSTGWNDKVKNNFDKFMD